MRLLTRGFGGTEDDLYEVITINGEPGAQTRNVEELSDRIERAGGMVVVGPQSSDFIVAVNNRLRFNVEPDPSSPGRYRITQSYGYLLGIGAAVVVLALLLLRK